MIKLRPHPSRRPGSTLLCDVTQDQGGPLSPGETVQLEAVPSGQLADPVFRLTAASAACWVREVGDADAEVRLFERLGHDPRPATYR